LLERIASIDTQDDYINHDNLMKTIVALSKNLDRNGKILYTLMFIAAVENRDDVTRLVKTLTNNFKDYDNQNYVQTMTPFEMATKDLKILNNAFDFSLKNRNVALLKYILEGAEKLYLNASICDEQILNLMDDLHNKTNKEILRYL